MSGVRNGVPRSRQREVRQEQLLEVAAHLFAHQGVDGTSTKEIARAAGVSPGLLYHYYPSKEDLMLAVVAHYDPTPHIRAVLEGNEAGSAREVLPRMLEDLPAPLFEGRREVLWLFFQAAGVSTQVKEALQRVGDSASGLLAGYLDARVRAGELRPHNTRRMAAAIYHTMVMEHLTQSPLRGDVQSLVDTLLYGLVPRD